MLQKTIDVLLTAILFIGQVPSFGRVLPDSPDLPVRLPERN